MLEIFGILQSAQIVVCDISGKSQWSAQPSLIFFLDKGQVFAYEQLSNQIFKKDFLNC